MNNLAQVLEWKYGPVASTASLVEVDFKTSIKDEDILSRNKTGTRVKILQINADKLSLDYDPSKIEMVITGWNSDKAQPGDKQLEKDFKEYESHLKAIAYKEKRAAEYPSIPDQLDALFKGGSDFDAMKSTIEAIKKKHPKG